MKSIIFIDSNKLGSSYEGIKAAKGLGLYTHLLTNKGDFLKQRENFPEVDEIHTIDLENMEAIKEKISQICSSFFVSAIISFIDSFVHLAASMSNQYCKTALSLAAIKIMENKILTRKHLHKMDYSPWYLIIKSNENLVDFLHLLEGKFPIVIKMPKSCGSKDVFFIHSISQLRHRLRYLRKRYPNEEILIEEYLDGPQYIVEVIAYKGKIEIAAVIEQAITNKERFIVTGYCVSPEIDQHLYQTLLDVSNKIMIDFGLENGNCHLELRHINGQWKLIEVNPRISGGVMNTLLMEAYRFNYAEQIVKVYLGDEPLLSKKHDFSVYAHFIIVGYIGILSKVTGENIALKTPGVVEVFIKAKDGQLLTPPLAMGHRYGYIIAKARTKKEAKIIALKAASDIQFQIIPI
ncbi:MAG TPA: ATP-grasp domain-containing protein [Neobacillus sp.]